VVFLEQRPQRKSISDPVGAPKNNPFGATFIELGGTKKCCTFLGLELVPKSRKKANWASQLNAQRSKMHENPLGPSEKIPFVENYKECAICAILRQKKPILGIPRG